MREYHGEYLQLEEYLEEEIKSEINGKNSDNEIDTNGEEIFDELAHHDLKAEGAMDKMMRDNINLGDNGLKINGEDSDRISPTHCPKIANNSNKNVQILYNQMLISILSWYIIL